MARQFFTREKVINGKRSDYGKSGARATYDAHALGENDVELREGRHFRCRRAVLLVSY